MSSLISIAFIGEGSTDYRFFSNIVQRLVESLLLEHGKEGTIQWQPVYKDGSTAADIVYNAALRSKFSTTLILHSDTDNKSVAETITYKLAAGIKKISESDDGEVCKNVIKLIPVTETEAWMLVDKDLLKSEINTIQSNTALGLTYQISKIEKIRDPKQKILDAIDIYHQSMNRKKRRNAVTIDELYETISQSVDLNKLEALDSYVLFKQDLISALKIKNIL